MKPDFDKLSADFCIMDRSIHTKAALIKLWNQAVDACAESAEMGSEEIYDEGRIEKYFIVNKQSILKNKITWKTQTQ